MLDLTRNQELSDEEIAAHFPLFYLLSSDRDLLNRLNKLLQRDGFLAVYDRAGRTHYLLDGRQNLYRSKFAIEQIVDRYYQLSGQKRAERLEEVKESELQRSLGSRREESKLDEIWHLLSPKKSLAPSSRETGSELTSSFRYTTGSGTEEREDSPGCPPTSAPTGHRSRDLSCRTEVAPPASFSPSASGGGEQAESSPVWIRCEESSAAYALATHAVSPADLSPKELRQKLRKLKRAAIHEVLRRFQFEPSLSGCRLIFKALELAPRDPIRMKPLSRNLYPLLARNKEEKRKPRHIERLILYAVQDAGFKLGNIDCLSILYRASRCEFHERLNACGLAERNYSERPWKLAGVSSRPLLRDREEVADNDASHCLGDKKARPDMTGEGEARLQEQTEQRPFAEAA